MNRRKRAAESSCFKREVTYNEFVADKEDYYYAAELRQADFQNDVYNFEVNHHNFSFNRLYKFF